MLAPMLRCQDDTFYSLSSQKDAVHKRLRTVWCVILHSPESLVAMDVAALVQSQSNLTNPSCGCHSVSPSVSQNASRYPAASSWPTVIQPWHYGGTHSSVTNSRRCDTLYPSWYGQGLGKWRKS